MSRLLFLLFFLALPAAAIDGQQILLKVDRNLEPESYEAYRKLIDIQPDGSRKEYVLYTLKKGRDKVVALFLSPASDKGRATLRLAENMWLYMPDVGRPIRVTSLQSVTGSSVSAFPEGKDRRGRLRPAQDAGRQATIAAGHD